jgi:SAM-dependent methyltransferase
MQRFSSWAVAAAREVWCVLLLPRRAAVFYVRALSRAILARDYSSLGGVTRPRELVPLLRTARASARIVEVGTGTAWTAICMALASPRARIATYDVAPSPYREPYVGMLDRATRARIEFLTRDGNDPIDGPLVDLVFIDASHECRDTIHTFRAWEPRVTPGGVVAFHDYADPNWPGVTDAVRRLRLDGRTHGHLFVWTKPGERR